MVEKKLYLHESGTYIEVPESEAPVLLNSFDGANCTEVRDLVVPAPVAPTQYIVVAREEAVNAVELREQAMGDAPVITDQASFDAVRAVVKSAKGTYNDLEAARVLAKAPFLEACRRVDEAARPLLARLDRVMKEGKLQEADYIRDRDARIAAENAARLALEAAAHQDTSRPTPALVLMELPEPLVAPLQTRRRANIVNPALIPREYLIPDMARIQADALGGKIIPGVEVVTESTLAAR